MPLLTSVHEKHDAYLHIPDVAIAKTDLEILAFFHFIKQKAESLDRFHENFRENEL